MFVVIWRFRAAAGREAEFEQVYGPAGAWARLFRSGFGYLGTELLRDTTSDYLTLDRWESGSAYEQWVQMYESDYRALDRECAELTSHETLIGRYSECHPEGL